LPHSRCNLQQLRKCRSDECLLPECEAAQTAEIETIIPIGNNLDAKQVVLVDDHKQLAPVVTSMEQNEFVFQRRLSLFERLLRLDYPYSLTEQYRATTDIMDFYARNIYDGNLTKAVDLGEHSASHLVRWWAEREYKIKDHEAIFIDVPNGVAEVEGVNKSMHNIIRGQSSSIRVHGRHPLTMVKLHLRDGRHR